MESTLEYLAMLHESFGSDYVMPNGYKADCLDVATEIATRLLLAGKPPFLMRFAEIKDCRLVKASLAPVKYGGKLIWDFHITACSGSEVYDPLVSKLPVPLKDYSVQAFGRQVPMGVFVSADLIQAVTQPLT